MRKMFFALVLLCLGQILTGCASGPKVAAPVLPSSFEQPAAAEGTVAETAANIETADYKFAPFDKLKVVVYRVPDLTSEYRIEPSGVVTFPLIGTMNIVGLSSQELGKKLEREYGAKYLERPDISVQLIEATGSEVTVEGSVKNPTVFAIFGETNLLQAIARAGGLDDKANAKKIVVFRKIDGETKAAAFNLSEIRSGIAENPTIQGGDIIVVDGSGLKSTYREILNAIPLVAIFTAFLR